MGSENIVLEAKIQVDDVMESHDFIGEVWE